MVERFLLWHIERSELNEMRQQLPPLRWKWMNGRPSPTVNATNIHIWWNVNYFADFPTHCKTAQMMAAGNRTHIVSVGHESTKTLLPLAQMCISIEIYIFAICSLRMSHTVPVRLHTALPAFVKYFKWNLPYLCQFVIIMLLHRSWNYET